MTCTWGNSEGEKQLGLGCIKYFEGSLFFLFRSGYWGGGGDKG